MIAEPFQEDLPAGPLLNRLVATIVCGHTGGLPDEAYPAYSTDLRLAFEAIDAFLVQHQDFKITIEYPFPEVWIKRNAEKYGSGWIPAAFQAEEKLPHAIAKALLKAVGTLV